MYTVELVGTAILYPFPIVNGLIIMAEELSATCTFDVIVFGLANTPFTKMDPGEITTVFAAPFTAMVILADADAIETLLFPLLIELLVVDSPVN